MPSSAAEPAQAPGSSRPTPLFEFSSQWRHWRFTQESLDKARQELNQGAVARVKSKLEEEEKEEIPVEAAADGSAPPPSRREYLTVPDELALVTFYLTKIAALCRASFFRFPENVEATAMTYLKRFYLRNTSMDYHPKNIMLTGLFLATKTENVAISIDAFASRIPNVTPDDVLSLEFLVAQSLRFEFKVHHAHTAARGIFLDLQRDLTFPESVEELERERKSWVERWEGVQKILRAARLTDAEFLYLPSQIALAAWMLVDTERTKAWLEGKGKKVKERDAKWAEEAKLRAEREKARAKVQPRGRNGAAPGKGKDATPATPDPPEPASSDLSPADLLKHLKPLMDLLRSRTSNSSDPSAPPPPSVDKDLVTAIDRRLKLVRNPEKDPNSALYRKRMREEEEREADKRREKRQATEMDEDDDPFGPSIMPADSKPGTSVDTSENAMQE